MRKENKKTPSMQMRTDITLTDTNKVTWNPTRFNSYDFPWLYTFIHAYRHLIMRPILNM